PLTFRAAAVGDIEVTLRDDGLLEMSFPNRAPETIAEPPQALLEALDIVPEAVLRNPKAWFVVYASEQQVRAAAPDLEALKALAPLDVVVTAPGDRQDFASRYFWPANGGDEDPVTGSIHAGLAPFWAERLGKKALTGYQASSRGGILNCLVVGDRVLISGNAVQYLKGTITIVTIQLPEQKFRVMSQKIA